MTNCMFGPNDVIKFLGGTLDVEKLLFIGCMYHCLFIGCIPVHLYGFCLKDLQYFRTPYKVFFNQRFEAVLWIRNFCLDPDPEL